MFTTRHRPVFLDPGELHGGAQPPEPTPPAEGTGATAGEQANWEERYREAQGWGTRLSQHNAELESEAALARALRSENADERQQALQALGLQLISDEEPDPRAGQLYDELPPHVLQQLAKVDELEQWRDGLTAEQESQANYASYRQITDPQLTQLGVPDGLHDVIAEAALNLPPVHTPQGPQPDLRGAWEQFGGMAEHFAAIPAVQNAVKHAWSQTKPRQALTSPTGVPGTRAVELDTRVKRADAIAQRIAELEAEEAAGA